MRNAGRHSRGGFTLVELMVTLAIMGIGLTLVLPRINASIRQARLEQTQARLQSDLKLAVSTAKATGRVVILNFTDTGYRVQDSIDSTRIYASNEVPSGVSMISSGNAQIFPWGLVDGGTVEISSSAGSSTLTILPTGKLDDGMGY
jgi:type II secretion system protein H